MLNNEKVAELDELTDTQRKMQAIMRHEIRAALWSEGPQILQQELSKFFRPAVDALRYLLGQQQKK